MDIQKNTVNHNCIFCLSNLPKISEIPYKFRARISLTFSQKYILALTKILYYTCYIPFKFEVNSTSNCVIFQVKTNNLQKILCILHFFGFFGTTYFFLCRAFGHDNPIVTQPNLILNASMVILGALLNLYFTCSVLFYEPNFRLLLENYQRQTNYLEQNQDNNFEEKLQNIFAIIYPLFSTVYSCSYMLEWNNLHEPGYQNRFFNPLIKHLPGLFTLFSNLPNVLYICVALTFRDRARPFIWLLTQSMLVNKGRSNSEHLILSEFLALDKYVNNLNQNFGIWIFAFSLLAIPYYSLKLTQIFHGTVIFSHGIIDLFYFVSTLCFLKMAADTSLQVSI